MVVENKELTAVKEKVPFKRAQVKLALNALLAHVSEEAKKKPRKDELFERDETLWLSMSVHRIPAINKKTKKIPLPHSVHGNASEVCFISKDPGKIVKETFQKKGVTTVTKVISLTKLRKEYKSFELKRKLLSSYDVFLCDDRVYHLVCKSLGKTFFRRRKEPIPVRLRYDDLRTEINKSLSCTMLRMGHGPTSSIKLGSISLLSEKQLRENVIHAMKVVARSVPGEWKNVKSFFVKTAESVALPLYQSAPVRTVKQLDDVISDKKAVKTIKFTLDDSDDGDDVGKNDADDAIKKSDSLGTNDVIENENPIDESQISDEEVVIRRDVVGSAKKTKGKKNVSDGKKKKKVQSERKVTGSEPRTKKIKEPEMKRKTKPQVDTSPKKCRKNKSGKKLAAVNKSISAE